jgi:predicted CoA-binding protein
MECEFPKSNASPDEIGALLSAAKNIAVVGISPKEERPSHWIAAYLMDHGYNVAGVNPGVHALFGRPVYKSLAEVPGPVDIVDIFRRSDAVPEIVDQAIAIKAKSIWMQEGIVHNAAAEKARAAGLVVVMNKCIYKEHAGRAR